jgi:hypothetical protein
MILDKTGCFNLYFAQDTGVYFLGVYFLGVYFLGVYFLGVYFLIVYFLIVKISLNAQKFSRKTNHEGDVEPSVRGAQRRYETTLYSCLLRLGVLEPKVRRTRGSSNQRFVEPEVRLWFKILQSFGKFQPLATKRRCPVSDTRAA